MGSHTFSYFCVSPVFSFSDDKGVVPLGSGIALVLFIKPEKSSFHCVLSLEGRQRMGGRDVLFQGSGPRVTAPATHGAQECFCSRAYKHNIHD